MTVNIKGYEVQIDPEDLAIVESGSWSLSKRGRLIYFHRNTRSLGNFYLHRVIMSAKKGQEIDHKDGNTLNNKKENLRFCTRSQNNYNMRPLAKSGLKGAYKVKRWWFSEISNKGNKIYLGCFKTKEEASEAYRIASLRIAGEFARAHQDRPDESASVVIGRRVDKIVATDGIDTPICPKCKTFIIDGTCWCHLESAVVPDAPRKEGE